MKTVLSQIHRYEKMKRKEKKRDGIRKDNIKRLKSQGILCIYRLIKCVKTIQMMISQILIFLNTLIKANEILP